MKTKTIQMAVTLTFLSFALLNAPCRADEIHANADPGGSSPVGSIVAYTVPSPADQPDTPGLNLVLDSDGNETGWLYCNGALLPNDAKYQKLKARLNGRFGKTADGTQFYLPDLRGRFPLGGGNGSGLKERATGDKGGEEEHRLTKDEMPSHRHGNEDNGDHPTKFYVPSGHVVSGKVGSGSHGVSPTTMTKEGGDKPHNTMPPFLVLQYIIRYTGAN